ncbi:hypothetical protein CR161_11100 [Prosthecochloris sp. ZM]|uniref:transposase family protein n=1 Tax=Prosthecochloris sp. ZM TaxID=2283143 RepID=UPI000DF7813A|nr:transposase family protein [Prosthecochloris sp. ZM]RDD31197.1 hypothetical protein CR161_11100 [Prosthecochloris sp. ZM]
MQSLTTHYQQLLGLPSTRKVEDVDLSMLGKQVVIRLVYTGKNISCPECGDTCNIYDHAPEQKWRHLDYFYYTIKPVFIDGLLAFIDPSSSPSFSPFSFFPFDTSRLFPFARSSPFLDSFSLLVCSTPLMYYS